VTEVGETEAVDLDTADRNMAILAAERSKRMAGWQDGIPKGMVVPLLLIMCCRNSHNPFRTW
jgi:hypothetical protein